MAKKGHNGPSGNYMALLQNDADMIRRWSSYYSRKRRNGTDTLIGDHARLQEVNKVGREPPYEPMPYDVFMAARIADYEIGH